MVNVSINDLAGEIALAVKNYTDDVAASVAEEVERTTKAVLKDIKDGSPVDSGEYKKGWRVKKSKGGGSIKNTIYQKTKPSLVHILENGYVRRSGVRYDGKPHLRPAYDSHVPQMERNIKRIIRDGG